MKKSSKIPNAFKSKDQRGVTIVLVAILMFVFLGVAALAIDLSYLYVVKNELQNAADAGALAGAGALYNSDGTAVNTGANQIAYNAATANTAMASSGGAIAVDVNWTPGQNLGPNVDVQRGHWSFGTHTFTANDTTTPPDLTQTTAQLDSDPNFINAVRVVARRQATPAASFFARIFGYQNFALSAQAVGYIGFAGTLGPGKASEPIAICEQSITHENPDGTYSYTCNTGRMINSGSNGATFNSAAWTNFTQPCSTATNPTISPLVCGSGNPTTITYGDGIGSTGGMLDSVYTKLMTCWLNAGLGNDSRGYPTQPWTLRLPVVDCPGNNPGVCSKVVGTVDLTVLWIKQSGTDAHYQDIPSQMGDWNFLNSVDPPYPPGTDISTLSDAQRQAIWNSFADHFNLKTADGTLVSTLSPSDLQKTIFFAPSCTPHKPAGLTGGENFGVLAKYPVLVH